MHKRLVLAQSLLKLGGVCFISIDDAEYENLKHICNDIFGEDNVDTMVWKKSGVGRDGKMKNTTTFRKDHEYIIVCYNHLQKLNKIKELPDFVGEYKNPDNDSRGPWLSGSISRADYASNENHVFYYTVKSPTGKEITRQFEISKEDFVELDNDGRISWGARGEAIPRLKVFLGEERAITPYSVLLNKGTTTEGTKEATKVIGKDSTAMRPKPSRLIEALIQIALPDNRPGLVLDFFAGTGTTGQAVLQHNLKYTTNHSFIVCTNNEDGIADDFTYPRIKSVVSGYENVAGIPANVRYFKTDFVDKQKTDDQTRAELVARSTDMICLREDAFEPVVDMATFKVFANPDHYAVIVFDEDGIEPLTQALDQLPDAKPAHIYVFSLSNDAYDSDFASLSRPHELRPIPESVLEVYRRIHQQNTKAGA